MTNKQDDSTSKMRKKEKKVQYCTRISEGLVNRLRDDAASGIIPASHVIDIALSSYYRRGKRK